MKRLIIGAAIGAAATVAGAGLILGSARGIDWLADLLDRHPWIDNKHVELEEVV
jgi:hypothetical protein